MERWILCMGLFFVCVGCSSTPEDDNPKTASFGTVLLDPGRLARQQKELEAKIAAAKAQYEAAVRQADEQAAEMEKLIKDIDQQASALKQEKGVDSAKLAEIRRLQGEADAAKAERERSEVELGEANKKLQAAKSMTPEQQQEALRKFKEAEERHAKALRSNETLKKGLHDQLSSLADESRRKNLVR